MANESQAPEQQTPPSAETLMIDDLAGQVARKSIDAAQWRARALLAENTLEKIKQADAEANE